MAELDWKPDGAVVDDSGIAGELVKFRTHAESGARYFGVRQLTDKSWQSRLVIGQTLVWTARSGSEDAAKRRAQGWEDIGVEQGDLCIEIDVADSDDDAQRLVEAEYQLGLEHPNKKFKQVRVSPIGIATIVPGRSTHDVAYQIVNTLDAIVGATQVPLGG
jgi:hypothetical protein